MTWDRPALLPIREEGVLRIFIGLKNPSPRLDFEPATFGSSGQHTNQYTTKATTKFHTHTKQLAELWFCLFYRLHSWTAEGKTKD
jgi:hypothetical protein